VARYDNRVVTETTSDNAPANVLPLLFPIGHQVGPHHRPAEFVAAQQVRRGGRFHDLTDRQAAVWQLAHGELESIDEQVAWQRESVEERLANTGEIIDELIALELLVEVTPGTSQAEGFARAHRLVPLMLGLGNSQNEPDTFGIGFLSQPILQVSHTIYDVWQWSTMDDSLWDTCENATDVARRVGATDPEATESSRLLTGFLGSVHALLATNAAYLDIGFRLTQLPDSAPAA
jgi:hypothetical protein